MASDFKRSVLNGDATNDAAVDAIDGGTGNGTCAIRVGVPPANVTDASTGLLLGTCTFASPAFGASSANLATANAISPDTSADNSGDAGYFRVYDGAAADTAALWQGTAGEAADTPDMVFDNKTIVAGGTIAITSMTYASKIA